MWVTVLPSITIYGAMHGIVSYPHSLWCHSQYFGLLSPVTSYLVLCMFYGLLLPVASYMVPCMVVWMTSTCHKLYGAVDGSVVWMTCASYKLYGAMHGSVDDFHMPQGMWCSGRWCGLLRQSACCSVMHDWQCRLLPHAMVACTLVCVTSTSHKLWWRNESRQSRLAAVRWAKLNFPALALPIFFFFRPLIRRLDMLTRLRCPVSVRANTTKVSGEFTRKFRRF